MPAGITRPARSLRRRRRAPFVHILPALFLPCKLSARDGMGWEWRVFFRASDVDGALEFVHPALRSGCEKQRTDVYQPVSDEVGLKERGGGGLELKMRSKRDANGWEKWSKSRVSEADTGEHVATSLAHQPPLPGVSDDPRLSWPRAEASHRCVRVSVAKCRVQECVGDALVEQTELQVSVGAGPVQVWRTVAVEGKRARCAHVVGEVLVACRQQSTDGQVELCGGYPAFVVRLANEAVAQPEPGAPCDHHSNVGAPSPASPAPEGPAPPPRNDSTGSGTQASHFVIPSLSARVPLDHIVDPNDD